MVRHFREKRMRRLAKQGLLVLVAALAMGVAGCHTLATESGSFDRNLTVNGPVRLEVTNGSGNTRVSPGASGEVRIHAEFQVKVWPWDNAERRVAEISQHPPVEQQGNLVRIGGDLLRRSNVTVNYTIIVPAETEVRGITGSGDLEVRGIHGPANLIAGSGNISADGINEDTQVVTGSGGISLAAIHGDVQATAGSGDIQLAAIQGEIRAHTGSGDISIAQPGAAVTAGAGSGDVSIAGASGDLRARTGSGDVSVAGNPAAKSYWEIHTSSGDVALNVPPDASFRLYARSSSGGIETAIPMIVEEKTSKHELRARIGDGRARVDVETSSGGIGLH